MKELVFVIFLSLLSLSNSFHPYFRLYSSVSGISARNAATADDVRKEEQVLKLKKQVGSVLQSTLEQLGATTADTSVVSEPILVSPPSQRRERSVVSPSSRSLNPVSESTESKELSQLGYSADDLKILKDTVKSRLIEIKLQRPSVIPSVWMKKEYRDLLVANTLPPSSSQNKRTVGKNNSNTFNGKLSARWVNPPSRQNEESEDSIQSTRESVDNEEGLQIWPSREEFKDMLLEESRLRVQAVGSWIAPLVRNENKWRFTIYDNWLKLLNEGFGDQMDILENEYTAQLIDKQNQEDTDTKPYKLPARRERDDGEKSMTKRRVITRKEEYDEFIKQQQEKIDAFLSEQSESKIDKIVGKKTRIPLPVGSDIIEKEEDLEKVFNKDNLFDEEDVDDLDYLGPTNLKVKQPQISHSVRRPKQRAYSNPLFDETDEV